MIKKSFIEIELAKSIEKLNSLEIQLANKPNGQLKYRIYNNGKTAIYHQYYDTSHKLRRRTLSIEVPDDQKLIEKFKSYYILSDKIRTTKQYINLLKLHIETLPACLYTDILDKIGCSEFASINSDISANSLWKDLNERQNKNFPENLKCNGHNGFYRSKSESIISRALFRNKILYKYEAQFMTPNKIIYPDFAISSPLRNNLIIWEHLGKMDDSTYNKKAKEKINLYESMGYYLNKNLIISYETFDKPFTEEDASFIIELIKDL